MTEYSHEVIDFFPRVYFVIFVFEDLLKKFLRLNSSYTV